MDRLMRRSRSLIHTSSRASHARHPLRRRLVLQALENRLTPATFTVNDPGDAGTGTGLLGDLRFCITQANDETTFPGADTIVFDASFSSAKTISLSGTELLISSDLSITGPGSGLLTIDAGALSRHFNIDTNAAITATIKIGGMTLTNGSSAVLAKPGGAIVASKSLSLSDVVITGCTAQDAGSAIELETTVGSFTMDKCELSANSISVVTGSFVSGALRFGGATTISVTNSKFNNNTADGGASFGLVGAAIGGYGTGNVTISGSTFTGNATDSGGGALFSQNSTTATKWSITDSTFTGNSNSVAFGGAIRFVGSGNVSIVRSTFDGNSSNGGGGAISSEGSVAASKWEILESTLSNNKSTAASGGAIAFLNGVLGLTVRNSTISGNSAANNGGGIRGYGGFTGTVAVQNSTIAFNTAGTTVATAIGGGLSRGAGVWSVTSSIVAKNTAPNSGDLSGTLTVNDSLIGATDGATITGLNNKTGTKASPLDPLLLPLANNGGPTLTHLPGAGSLARNNGSNPAGLTTDQRGGTFARILDGKTDIGSIESSDPTPTASASFTDVTVAAAEYTFQVTYADSNAINISTLDNNDITVSGPGFGVPQKATFVSVDNPANGSPRTATYKFAAPGAGWTVADNGTYTVDIVANQVFDTDAPTPVAVTGGKLGTFKVGLATTYTVDEATDVDDGNTAVGFLSFREAVKLANTGPASQDIIVFDAKAFSVATKITMNGTPIEITDGIKITGPASALTLDANLLERHLSIPAASFALDVQVTGISFINGLHAGTALADLGGSIFSEGNNITLTNCSFDNNSTETGGGAVGAINGSLNIAKSAFTNNKVTGDGFVGGAVSFFQANGTVTDSTFDKNSVVGPTGAGGAIGVFGNPTVTFKNATISNNSVVGGPGGGIWTRGNSFATLVIENSTISNNSAGGDSGGGVYVGNASKVTITSTKITGNTAGTSGGGFYSLQNATVSITNSTISGNTAQAGNGGGLTFYYNGSLTLDSSTVSGNSASGKGGGIYFYGNATSFLVRNSTISTNTSGAEGGGVAFEGLANTATFLNSTIAFNDSTTAGGGIARASGTGTISLSSTIVAANTVGKVGNVGTADLSFDTAATNVAGDNNLIGVQDASTNVTLTGTGNLTGDAVTPLNAKLGALANNGGPTETHALAADSPAVNAGNNNAGLKSDQRGFQRVAGGTIDIGAYEFGAVAAAPPTVTSFKINGGTAQRSNVTTIEITFSEAVTLGAGAFTLDRVGLPSGLTNDGTTLGSVNVVISQVGSTVTITFATGGVVDVRGKNALLDGKYTFVMNASKISGIGGQLDGDGNGTGGDNRTDTIRTLFGDGDGDGDVDIQDFALFRAAFNGADPSVFSYDADADIDLSDFSQFRGRFSINVP